MNHKIRILTGYSSKYPGINKFIFILLAFLLTFPDFDYTFSWGIDPSLRFLFHYINDSQIDQAREIIFPYGPLTYLMYPLFSNPWPSIIVNIVLNLSILYFLFNLINKPGPIHQIVVFIAGFIILWLNNYYSLLIVLVAILLLNALKSKKNIFALLAAFVTALSMYVKLNAAIIAGLLLFSYLLITLTLYNQRKNAIINSSAFFAFLVLIWIFIFKDLNGFINYFIGQLHLALGNQSGASIYAPNNAFFLSMFFITLLIFIISNTTKKSKYFILLLTLPAFAAWKHGVGRQDVIHFWIFCVFLISITTVYFVYTINEFKWTKLFLIPPLFFVFLNFHHCYPWSKPLNPPGGLKSFSHLISNFSNDLINAKIQSEKRVREYELPDSVKNIIENKTIDIYPWDYAYLAANNLNWIPRPEIQAFLSYTDWIEERNIRHFLSDIAPEFILWHFSKEQGSINPGKLYGIDNRYLLNEEPELLISLIKNYYPVFVNHDFILYEKWKEALSFNISSLEKGNIEWDKWYPVKDLDSEFFRLKLDIQHSIPGIIKSFSFKDEFFYLYLKFADGLIIKQRIIPSKALKGVWINPLILNPEKSTITAMPESFMIKKSGKHTIKDHVSYEVEGINSELSDNRILSFFMCNPARKDSVLFTSFNDFERPSEFWKPGSIEKNADQAFSGENSNLILPGQTSSTFIFPVDSLLEEKINIYTSAWCLAHKKSRGVFIISLESDGEAKIYKYVKSEDQVSGIRGWCLLNNGINVDLKKENYEYLKVYFWNTDSKAILMDDINVRIIRIPD